jgi:hypothetical protein
MLGCTRAGGSYTRGEKATQIAARFGHHKTAPEDPPRADSTFFVDNPAKKAVRGAGPQ